MYPVDLKARKLLFRVTKCRASPCVKLNHQSALRLSPTGFIYACSVAARLRVDYAGQTARGRVICSLDTSTRVRIFQFEDQRFSASPLSTYLEESSMPWGFLSRPFPYVR
jgi:hypothetical protein